MSYTIRSRFSTASSPVFTGGDRLTGGGRMGRMLSQQDGNPAESPQERPLLLPGPGSGPMPPYAAQATGPSNQVVSGINAPLVEQTGGGAPSGPQADTGTAITPVLTVTPEQVQAIQMQPALQPLIAQLVAGESAGTVVLSSGSTGSTPTPVPGDLGPSGPTDVQPLPGATGGSLAPSLDAGATATAPVDYSTQTATGPTGVSGDTGPQGPDTGTSGLFGTDIPTPEPTPTYSGDSVLDPGLYAPPMDAIDYTNTNLTAT